MNLGTPSLGFLTVLARLNDLPNTFKRIGPPYTNLIDSVANALTLFTQGSDATSAQFLSASNALDGWLDVWGLLWGVPRIANEANATYSVRIARTVLAWVGTVPAIQAWMNFYAPGGAIKENASGLGYVLTFPATMTVAQVNAFVMTLLRIRPVGVPFAIVLQGGGIYLGDSTFLGTDDYLTAGTTTLPYPGSPCTPNTVPLLPSLLMQDPTINPSQ